MGHDRPTANTLDGAEAADIGLRGEVAQCVVAEVEVGDPVARRVVEPVEVVREESFDWQIIPMMSPGNWTGRVEACSSLD